MGWLSKVFKGNKRKGQHHKYDNEEDESSNNESSSEPEGRSVDCDMGETDSAAYHFSPNDGYRWNNDVTDHDYHHNYIEAHYLRYDYEGQYKIAPYSMDVENQSLTSQQQYHIDSPRDSESTFQVDPWFFPSYSLFPVCQTHINYGFPNSSSVWNRAHPHHSHESYFPSTTYEESQDLISENSTSQTLRCYICKNLLQTGVDGHLKYKEHRFWQQKYCPYHDRDGTPKCFSCRRLMARDSNPLSLSDGRKICGDCQGTFIIMTIQDCQPLIREIQQLYKKLEMKVDQYFPIRLVGQNEINKRSEDRATTILCSTRLGVTVPEPNYIRIAVNTPKIAQTGEILRTDKKSFKLVGNEKVKEIRVLNGLPRLYTGSILAHEMLHAWFCQEGHHINMDQVVYEGTCQVVSYIWLRSKVNSMSKSSYEWKLGKFYMYGIRTKRRKDIYGIGFRRAKKLRDRYGLRETLKIVQFTGGFLDDLTQQ